MPPTVAGFDAEADGWPRQVDVDDLSGAQGQRMLTHGFGQAGPADCVQHVELETALGRARAQRRLHQPSLESHDATPSASADGVEVVGRRLWRDEPEVPGVFGRSIKSVVVERAGEAKQHSQRGGHVSRSSTAVLQRLAIRRSSSYARARPHPGMVTRQVSLDRDLHRASRHASQTVQHAGAGAADGTLRRPCRAGGPVAIETNVSCVPAPRTMPGTTVVRGAVRGGLA